MVIVLSMTAVICYMRFDSKALYIIKTKGELIMTNRIYFINGKKEIKGIKTIKKIIKKYYGHRAHNIKIKGDKISLFFGNEELKISVEDKFINFFYKEKIFKTDKPWQFWMYLDIFYKYSDAIIRIFRFMSKSEFNKFLNEKNLLNQKDFSKEARSSSRGFCFLEKGQISPEESLEYLSGIVNTDICAVFDIPIRNMSRSSGAYSSNDATIADVMYGYGLVSLEEWCIEKYNSSMATLVEFAANVEEGTPFNWRTYRP